VLLLALGVALGSLALSPEVDLDWHDYYDGDGDDAGHVGKMFSQWVDAGFTDTRLTFTPSTPIRCPAPVSVATPPQIARTPLGSRPPPT
jgi:hypothetical protein